MFSVSPLSLHDPQRGQRLEVVLQPRPPQDHRPPMSRQPDRRRRVDGVGPSDAHRVHHLFGKTDKNLLSLGGAVAEWSKVLL